MMGVGVCAQGHDNPASIMLGIPGGGALQIGMILDPREGWPGLCILPADPGPGGGGVGGALRKGPGGGACQYEAQVVELEQAGLKLQRCSPEVFVRKANHGCGLASFKLAV